jgi:hypothetical protein
MRKLKTSKPKDSSSWRDSYYHKLLGFQAASRVEHLLSIFEKARPKDRRPRKAVRALKAWSTGERRLRMTEVRELSLSAHAAARAARSEAARLVAHAAGQAVATWHVPTHALGAFEYAGRAFVANKNQPGPGGTIKAHTAEELAAARRTIRSMIDKIAKAQEHFARGTPQHTLARNRLKALRIASALITKSLRQT